jgi:hypothetical protein
MVRKLKTLLNVRVIEKLQRELGSRFASSPPMRSLFVHGTKLRLRNEIPKHDYLLWLGKELYENGKVVPLEIFAMEMNRVVQQDKAQKSRITPMVARFLADLSLAYELRSWLQMIFPQLFDKETLDQQAELADRNEWGDTPGIHGLYDLKMITAPAFAGNKFLRLGDIGNPFQFLYSVHKKRPHANVESMQRAERQLDMVWEKHDTHLKKHLKPEVYTLLQSAWSSRGELQRTPDWIAPVRPAKKTTQKPADAEYITSFIPEQQSSSKLELPIRKEKRKSRRPADDPSTAPVEPAEPAIQHKTSTPPAPRSKKAQHTFSTMFFKPSTDSQPGEVPWTDSVSAMSAICQLR